MIYLDNAATTSPKPELVVREVNRALRQYSANPGRGGHTPSINAAKAVYQVRTLVKDFFHLNNEENVIFTSGCTHSLNMVMNGVLQKGDHVVISSLEHNSVLRPLHRLHERKMIDYTVVNVPIGDDGTTIDAFRSAINARTRMIICTHASNVFGIRLPVERLCALAHSYGILFCLDAAQSAGVLDLNVEENGYDYVCCAGHKGLYAPTGIGLLLLSNEQLIEPLILGGTGSNSADPQMPDYYPDRLESGTLNIPGICGLGGGLRFVRSRGIDNIARHEMKLIQRLYRALLKMNKIELYTPEPTLDLSVPVLSFNIKDTDSEAASTYLNDRYGIAVRAGLHCAPLAHQSMGTIERGTVRVAPSVFTSEKDIQFFVNAINNFVHTT